MPKQKELLDETRIRILDALFKERSLIPNLNQIQKYTGYHKATIKSSLEFMKREGLIQHFTVKLNYKKLGFNLEPMVLLQIDTSKKKLFNDLLERIKKDDNLYRMSSIIGSGNLNILARHIYPDVETYHTGVEEKFYGSMKGIHDLIKDRQIYFTSIPFYKDSSRSESVLKAIKKQKGLD
ncbi:MAG: hypothetical protein ABH821_05650 [archaeon]